jgi:hypothetical protein
VTALAPLEDRIRVHVILCRLALHLVRIVEITRLSRRLSPSPQVKPPIPCPAPTSAAEPGTTAVGEIDDRFPEAAVAAAAKYRVAAPSGRSGEGRDTVRDRHHNRRFAALAGVGISR